MSLSFHEFSPYRNISIDPVLVRHTFDKYLSDPSTTIVILAVDPDKGPVGIIVGIKTQIYFSDTYVAGELIWWIDEGYRHTGIGIKLFKAFEEWGRRVGASFLNAVNTNETTELSGFYAKNGMRHVESSYIKEL